LLIEAYPVEVVGLPFGDYSIRGFHDLSNPGFVAERKSTSDLIGSLTHDRTRFLRECEGLRRYRFATILIEGHREDIERHGYRSLATPRSVLASLDCIEVRCGIHIAWCGSAEGAARRLEGLVRQFVRGIEKDYRRLIVGGEKTEQGPHVAPTKGVQIFDSFGNPYVAPDVAEEADQRAVGAASGP